MSFDEWVAALEARHLADLTFREVSRSLRALSSLYVERRGRIQHGAALDGRGKRAAFALFYGPLHFLIVRHVVSHVDSAREARGTLVDLGCGTGAAGAAWAAGADAVRDVVAIDRNAWALGEARWTYEQFALRVRTHQADAARAALPASTDAILAAFTANELADADRDVLLARLVSQVAAGRRVLVVEPVARGVARWWNNWREAFASLGGRSDEWRFRAELPAIVAKLDRAAGLDHRELTARSIYCPGQERK